jgi:hypothetical protein
MSANKENAVAKLFNEQVFISFCFCHMSLFFSLVLQFVKVDTRKRISQETFDSVVEGTLSCTYCTVNL